MWEAKNILKKISQLDEINFSILSSKYDYNFDKEVYENLLKPHRAYYFLLILIQDGSTVQKIDFKQVALASNEFGFILPRQVYQPTIINHNTVDHYKVVFDEELIRSLGTKFMFLLNPFNLSKVSIDTERKKELFYLLSKVEEIVQKKNHQSYFKLFLAYCNTLFTELEIAYFKANDSTIDDNDDFNKFIDFKLLVEDEIKNNPAVSKLSRRLAISDNVLYNLVKKFSGTSPKTFIAHRIILEAQRILFHSDVSIKELAFDLGFNDPDHFSRLFKRETGVGISEFKQSLTDLSGS